MFDFDNSGLDSLELGSRRRPVKWAVELSLADCRPQKHKARRRQAAQEAAEREQKQHTLLQQAAQQQRLAAHRKHLEQLAMRHQQDPSEVTPAQAKHRKEFRDSSVVCLSTEIEQGNVEYKYRLTGCITNENRRHQLITQMKFRLSEGSGECFYYLGVEDDGYPRGLESQELQDSVAVIHRMAVSLQATARLVEYVPGGFGRRAALLHIKANATEDMRVTDSRIAVAGSMDSGKSTLVAVLTHGVDGRPLLDNGRGSARMAVFRHKHEIESGRTSSISQQVLGYDDEGRVLNYVGVATPTPADITAAATHILNFIDMGGHEKYLKTTLYGMTCLLPDYALLCVDAATGITRITREHLAVAVALEVPTALLVTKADAVDELQLQQVLEQLHQLMMPVLHSCSQTTQQQHELQGKQPGCAAPSSSSNGCATIGCSDDVTGGGGGDGARAEAWHCGVPVVQTEQQAVALATSLSELHSCTAAPAAPSFQQVVFPVFVTSCVTGAGIPLLHAFLSHLKPLQQEEEEGGSTSSGSSSAEQRGRGADAASESHVKLEQQQQQQQPQRQQRLLSPCPKPASSSQLWGVASSPPRQQPEIATAAAATAAEGDQGADTGPVQAAAQDADCCMSGHFQVVHTYDVEGVGWVVSGITVTGAIEVGQSLLWGPTPEGGFSPVRVTCIQRSHIPVRQVAPGQTATLALQPTAAGLPHSGSRQALLTAAAVAQATAAEAAAREAAAAIAAVPEPVAKTRRRSPAALKAAAAAAASTAAAAAAAAAAAQRAAETAGGRAWWLLPEFEAAQTHGPADAAPAAAAEEHIAGRLQQQAAGSERRASQPAAAGPAAAAAGDSVADVLDDDFAAELAADSSGDDSTTDLFGADLDAPQPGSSRRRVGAEAPTCDAAADDEMFGGLAIVLGQGDEQQQQQQALSRGNSNTSSSSSADSSSSGSSATAGGLSGSWSFSSGSSCSGGQDGAAPCVDRAHISSTTDAAAHGAAGLREAAGSAPSAGELQLLGTSPSRWRNKGGVLLGVSAAPHTYWEFDALLVLLGGYWPPRGLLSGRWPPGDATAGMELAGQQGQEAGSDGQLLPPSPADKQQQQRGRKQRSASKRYEFAYVIHCNSIRQVASVVSMRELRDRPAAQCIQDVCIADSSADSSSSSSTRGADAQHTQMPSNHQRQEDEELSEQHCGLTASIRAAAALLQGASAAPSDKEASPGCVSGDSSSGSSSSGDGSGSGRQRRSSSHTLSGCTRGGRRAATSRRGTDAGSVVVVRFKFMHRPEWMQVGARFIVRDRSDGHVAAAGFVTKLLEPHTQLQQHPQQQGRERRQG